LSLINSYFYNLKFTKHLNPIQYISNSYSNDYRFGFNGKEKDDEVYGSNNYIDFGERGYDPRTGRFSSVDKLWKKYPNESNYSFTSNKPIVFAENDGKDKIYYLEVIQKDGTKVTVATYREVNKTIKLHTETGTGDDGMGGNTRAFFTDTKQTITLDLRNSKTSISDETSDYSSKYSLIDGMRKIMTGTSKDQQPGGINWTSETGQSEENRVASTNVRSESIDKLINAVTKMANGGPVELTLSGITKFAKEGIETGKDVKDGVEAVTGDSGKTEGSMDFKDSRGRYSQGSYENKEDSINERKKHEGEKVRVYPKTN